MTTTSTLTDRYVAQVLRGIPADRRLDIERELRSSIADAVEARLRTGADEAAAEKEALAWLGDPALLAARYAERPLHLIGPELYLGYARLLKTLLATAVPLVFTAAAVAGFAAGGTPVPVLPDAAGTALMVALHITFWVTVVFAAAERAPAARRRWRPRWDPSALPQVPSRRVDLRSLAAGTAVSTGIACVLVLIQLYGPVPVFTPALWESGALYLAVVFAATRIVFDLVGYHVGWDVPHAVANAVLGAMFAAATLWVTLSGRLLNDAFLDGLGWRETTVAWVISALVLLMAIGDSVDGFVRTRRSMR